MRRARDRNRTARMVKILAFDAKAIDDEATVGAVCTLGEFIDANETLSKEELQAIVGLEVGERTEWYGGGAAPQWALKRIR